MPFEKLKGKLTDEEFAELQRYAEEQDNKQKALRKKADELQAKLKAGDGDVSRLLEKLGIASVDEIDGLPDAKGQAEASKQMEAKLKKLETLLAESKAENEKLVGTIRDGKKKAALAEALSGHDLIDADVVAAFIKDKIDWDGDDLVFKTDTGGAVSVKDGVAQLLKTRPSLLKTPAARGSGYKPGGTGVEVNPFAKEMWNTTKQIELQAQNPQLAAELKAAAAK